MKQKFYLIIILCAFGCVPSKIVKPYNAKTLCVTLEANGKQVVKAWGQGGNYTSALEDAKANAINDIIFNGIYDGDAACNKIPLVPEVNARKKYETYFNTFFSKDGLYTNFVSVFGRFYKMNVAEGVTLEVDVPKLKQQLINDGILKAQ
jgi:hypothetical protein